MTYLVHGWLCWTCEPKNGLPVLKWRHLWRHRGHETRQFDFLPSQLEGGVP